MLKYRLVQENFKQLEEAKNKPQLTQQQIDFLKFQIDEIAEELFAEKQLDYPPDGDEHESEL